jgi:hypothetical protein
VASRLDGDREPNGRLQRHPPTPPKLLEHRRIWVAGFRDPERPKHFVDPADARLSYPIGVLYLRGRLTKSDHDAAVEYANLFAAIWGKGSVRSHLQAFTGATSSAQMDDARRREKASKLGEATRILYDLPTHRPYRVLVNLAVYEHPMRFMDLTRARSASAWAADERDCEALQEATDALARHWGLDAKRPALAQAHSYVAG